MKKFRLMLVLAVLFVSTQIFAQNRPFDADQMAARQTERMKENLSLTADQEAKILEINKALAIKMQAARDNGELTADNRGEFRRKQSEERDAEYKKVLNEEQWAKWETMKKEQQNRGNRERSGNGQKRNQPGT